jgi:hypothetical protein
MLWLREFVLRDTKDSLARSHAAGAPRMRRLVTLGLWLGTEPGLGGWSFGLGVSWTVPEDLGSVHSLRCGWGWDAELPFAWLPLWGRLLRRERCTRTEQVRTRAAEKQWSWLGLFVLRGLDTIARAPVNQAELDFTGSSR